MALDDNSFPQRGKIYHMGPLVLRFVIADLYGSFHCPEDGILTM